MSRKCADPLGGASKCDIEVKNLLLNVTAFVPDSAEGFDRACISGRVLDIGAFD